MFYGHYNPMTYLYKSSPPTPSPRKPIAAPSSILLEIMLVLHTILYFLGLLAVPVIQNGDDDHQQAAEMMVVGSCGCLTSSLALMGIWYHQKQFLLPLLVFLFATIVLDSVCLFQYYHLIGALEEFGNKLSFYPINDSMMPFLILKLLLSMYLVKSLISIYRWNLTIRTGRSPLRNKSQTNNDDICKVEESLRDQKGSPVQKLRDGNFSKFENCVREEV